MGLDVLAVWVMGITSDFLLFLGSASRQCLLNSHGVAYWSLPSFARCISHEYRYLHLSVSANFGKATVVPGNPLFHTTWPTSCLVQRRAWHGERGGTELWTRYIKYVISSCSSHCSSVNIRCELSQDMNLQPGMSEEFFPPGIQSFRAT